MFVLNFPSGWLESLEARRPSLSHYLPCVFYGPLCRKPYCSSHPGHPAWASVEGNSPGVAQVHEKTMLRGLSITAFRRTALYYDSKCSRALASPEGSGHILALASGCGIPSSLLHDYHAGSSGGAKEASFCRGLASFPSEPLPPAVVNHKIDGTDRIIMLFNP